MKNVKSMYCQIKKQFRLTFLLVFATIAIQAQDIHFTFANAQKTIENGNYYYEVDVMIEASEAFKLGSGQVYLTYNPEAFGDNISKHNAIQYKYDSGYILGENYTLPAYKSFVQNDNTVHRVSFAFQQGVSAETITKANVTTIAKLLFHIKIKYMDATKDPMIAFEEGVIFQDQFFTACGSMLKSGIKAGFPDCANLPGIQLINDTYDSSGAALQTLNIEEQQIDTISLYPNPVKEFFTIRGLGSVKSDIYITDLNGKLVQTMIDHSLDRTIDVTRLQSGVYFVQIDKQNSRKTYKLIKE
ncbi:T9SS type A sorting domain-containing protein [Aquimarina litoralis]|uniref:T9SS type A sorting domain-containing protein n=1 Tax=Aquimarina litoralis TaxID=584605 RepID=UPI001C587DE5|nr:T9SS type A sorting domain-containing protein [Aquimarina litoralis]MBW1298603.1 T9SS type A sorting domain-containing protein [Aquimarina litoralis]